MTTQLSLLLEMLKSCFNTSYYNRHAGRSNFSLQKRVASLYDEKTTATLIVQEYNSRS